MVLRSSGVFPETLNLDGRRFLAVDVLEPLEKAMDPSDWTIRPERSVISDERGIQCFVTNIKGLK
jgi:hypothetical protein